MKNNKTLLIITILLFSLFITTNVQADTPTYLSITLLSPNTSPARNQWALLIESELPKIGIGVSFHNSTSWAGIAQRTWAYPLISYSYIPTYAEGGYDVVFNGWSWAMDLDLTNLFDTASIHPLGGNYYQYSNSIYDNLLEDYVVEPDQVERTNIAHDMLSILYEDLPAIPIVYSRDLFGYKVGLTGIDNLLFDTSNHRPEYWDDPDDHIIKYAIPTSFMGNNIYDSESFFDWQWLQCVGGALAQREQGTHMWSPLIAKNWTIDGPLLGAEYPINITVNLDPDAKFSDGEPVLPEDVKYSYQLHMSPLVGSDEYGILASFFGNEAINPTQGNNSIEVVTNVAGGQMIFHLTKIYNFPLSILKYQILDKYKGDGTGVDELIPVYGYSILNLPPGHATIGFNLVKSCGAFQLNTFDIMNSIAHLIPNTYWDDTIVSGGNNALLTDLYIAYVSGKESALSELKLGMYDIMDARYYATLADFEGETSVEGVLVEGLSHEEISVNMKHPMIGTGELTPLGTPLAAKYLRKAISHAIPRQTIVDDILNGIGAPGVVPVPDGCIGFDDSLNPYSYNLTLAQEYVELAFGIIVSEFKVSNLILIMICFGLVTVASYRYRKLKNKRNK